MSDLLTNLTYVYMQIGVTGLIIVFLVVVAIWWITKGKKRSDDAKLKYAEEYARIGKVMENNTAAINNNTKVIEANTLQRANDQHCLEKLDERMARHGDQLDAIQRSQDICLDRLSRK